MLARKRAGELHAAVSMALSVTAGSVVRHARGIAFVRRRGRYGRADLRDAAARRVLLAGTRVRAVASAECADADRFVWASTQPTRAREPAMR